MRVLIIEDEIGALDDLRSHPRGIGPGHPDSGHDGECHAKRRMAGKNPAPDLIFMDIHLSDGSAFEIFKRTAVEAP